MPRPVPANGSREGLPRPAPSRRGQVIPYGRDKDVKAVLVPSLGAFSGWIAGAPAALL